jgi:glycosyltransferase involved in cell wall biosynthesis
MNALHVIPALAPRYGGPSAATLGMCRALEGAGVRTLIATTDADGSGRLDVRVGLEETFNGIPAVFFRRHFGEAFKWSSGIAAWLRRNATRFDVVHVHAVFSHSSIAAGSAAHHAGVPYIVRPLGTLDPWSVKRKSTRKRLLLGLGGRALVTRAARMHYTSDDEQRLAESVIGGLPPGAVIPVGIDDDYFDISPRRDESAPMVLSLSRLDDKKRIDVLIEAFHHAAADRGNDAWTLVIAGDGPPALVGHLKSLARRGAARDRITFTGWVSGADKIELFRRASLFALPSHQENFGISVAEAMASAVPVVVTPGVNLSRDVEQAGAGWVVEEPVTSVAAGLTAAMRDIAERERRGRQARVLAERFRWKTVGRSLAELYGRVRHGRDGEARG